MKISTELFLSFFFLQKKKHRGLFLILCAQEHHGRNEYPKQQWDLRDHYTILIGEKKGQRGTSGRINGFLQEHGGGEETCIEAQMTSER